MRRTFGWSDGATTSAGTAAGTSSPPPPRPCAASSSKPPAASTGRSAAATSPAATSTPTNPRPPGPSPRLLALDEALDRLAAIEPRAAEVVKLRYFAGLTVAEAAAALGISPRTADNDWAYARAWLVTALHDED